MPHEQHPCGLKRVTPEPAAECGLRHIGSAEPVWNMACALLYMMLRPRTPVASRNPRPDVIPSYSLPDYNLDPGLVSARH